MSNKQTHIVPHQGGWASKDTGNDRASRVFDNKQDAVNWGREHSRNVESEFVIHNRNGQIGQKDSHGNDDFPPKG
ncbi:hypothetical protein SAMN04488503_2457 [Humidesulfovibrio mexicanus]|uniref:DUF2188 domain-containing protein n=1 Tax=Humidesulfovibrio mexicanus TaxID=147047 RepID=A0A239B6A2_9BACT|nr:DUF2188 domain-containing protein [Humidesulfovibrio mexicanus]SNS03309.1 hypothetical protein SAMN04488503_2457 [Humidesulfovibrio mexicanus]